MTNATHYVQKQRGCLNGEDTSSCAGITEETSLCSLALKLGDMAQHVPMFQCLPCAPGRALASKPPAGNVLMVPACGCACAAPCPWRGNRPESCPGQLIEWSRWFWTRAWLCTLDLFYLPVTAYLIYKLHKTQTSEYFPRDSQSMW